MKTSKRGENPGFHSTACWQGLIVVLWLASCGMSLVASPRAPWPPWPEQTLQRWDFDEAYWARWPRNSDRAFVVNSELWQESWSGYALNRQGVTVKPAVLPMATRERWNVAPSDGALRFWFKPDWSSGQFGNGPGQYARLVELTSESGKSSVVWWSFYVSQDGNTLHVSGEGVDGPADYLKVEIRWLTGEWHLLALSYTEKETRLHVDGQLVAVGVGVPALPIMVASSTQLTLGSDATGQNVAGGQFEELCTFDQPFADVFSEWALNYYYAGVSPQAAKGPVTEAETAAVKAEAAAMKAASAMALLSPKGDGGGGLYSLESIEGLYLLTPVIAGTNVTLTLWNGQTNESYNILFTTDVAATNWQTAAIGSMGQTNFPLVMTNAVGFYRAEVGDDFDGDGIKNWVDAQPSNTNVGALTVTIDSPTDGSVLQ
jgi:hypothetical protein